MRSRIVLVLAAVAAFGVTLTAAALLVYGTSVPLLAAVAVVSVAAAVAAGMWLHGRIAEPIVAVTDAARDVIRTHEFSIRVAKQAPDETGELTDAFNTMLEQIATRSDALVDADRMKDEFLATLAHELRNPLAPMTNALHLMRAARGKQDVVENAQAVMERQLRQMARLVDDLLDVSRITSGRLILRSEVITLSAVVESAVEIARPLIDAKRHVLKVALPPSDITLSGDATRLAQVFGNLLNNAAKCTDPGGRIEVSARLFGDYVEAAVADSGCGISAERLPHVFDMFSHAESKEGQGEAGLGLGLALAKRFVELHGGTIEVMSAGPRQGSRFTVRLPLGQPGGEAGQPQAAVTAQKFDLNAVVIDDNVDFASSFAEILQALGSDTRIAHDGRAGLELIRATSPDVAFIDLGMPNLNGYELARKLRERREHDHVLLVAVTGWGQTADRAEARAAGFDAHVVKPVDPAQLPALLQQAAHRRDARRRA